MLPPRIDIFEIGAGGVLEKIDEWSRTGADNVLNAFLAELEKRKGLQVSQLDIAVLSEENKIELEQTQLLFDAVRASVVIHIYGIPGMIVPPHRFEDKISNFDYSLGSDTAKVNVLGADAFLMARGRDHISSGARHATQATAMLVAAALGAVVIPRGGITLMDVALVDARTGEILWFTSNRAEGTDLRKPWSVNAFVMDTLAGFPIQ